MTEKKTFMEKMVIASKLFPEMDKLCTECGKHCSANDARRCTDLMELFAKAGIGDLQMYDPGEPVEVYTCAPDLTIEFTEVQIANEPCNNDWKVDCNGISCKQHNPTYEYNCATRLRRDGKEKTPAEIVLVDHRKLENKDVQAEDIEDAMDEMHKYDRQREEIEESKTICMVDSEDRDKLCPKECYVPMGEAMEWCWSERRDEMHVISSCPFHHEKSVCWGVFDRVNGNNTEVLIKESSEISKELPSGVHPSILDLQRWEVKTKDLELNDIVISKDPNGRYIEVTDLNEFVNELAKIYLSYVPGARAQGYRNLAMQHQAVAKVLKKEMVIL